MFSPTQRQKWFFLLRLPVHSILNVYYLIEIIGYLDYVSSKNKIYFTDKMYLKENCLLQVALEKYLSIESFESTRTTSWTTNLLTLRIFPTPSQRRTSLHSHCRWEKKKRKKKQWIKFVVGRRKETEIINRKLSTIYIPKRSTPETTRKSLPTINGRSKGLNLMQFITGTGWVEKKKKPLQQWYSGKPFFR